MDNHLINGNAIRGGCGQNHRGQQRGRGRQNHGRSHRHRSGSRRQHSSRYIRSFSANAASSSHNHGESSHSQSGESDANDMPGYYYDAEKKKYFKIVPGNVNGQQSAVTRESIREREAEKERKKKMHEFSQMLQLKSRCSCTNCTLHPHSGPRRNIFTLLEQRALGRIPPQQYPSSCIATSMQALQLAGKHTFHSYRHPPGAVNAVYFPPNVHKLQHMYHIWPNSTGEYMACLWQLNSGQLTMPVKVKRLEAVDEGRKLKFEVNQEGVSIFQGVSRVSAGCWVKTSFSEELLLYATNYTGYQLESEVILRDILPDEGSYQREAREFRSVKVGQRMTWACAWNKHGGKGFGRLSVGTERCALVMDLDTPERQGELHTGGSDVLAQTFHQDDRLLHSGTRSGLILAHDTRGGCTCAPKPLWRLGAKRTSPHTPSAPICSLVQLKHNHNHIVSSDFDGKISLWDIRQQDVVLSYPGNKNEHSTIPVRVCEEDDLVYSAGTDSYVRVWSLSTGALLQVIPPTAPPPQDDSLRLTHIPTVCYLPRALGNVPVLLVGARDEMLAYTL